MPQIKAQDSIKIKCSVENVWKFLTDIPGYNTWWPKVVNLRILKFDEEIIGTEFNANPLGGKSFSCRVISFIPYKEIKLEYFNGIYRGTGVWNIISMGGLVRVSYTVDLKIVDNSIAVLSRILPITKLHSMIFKKILKGLAEKVSLKSKDKQK